MVQQVLKITPCRLSVAGEQLPVGELAELVLRCGGPGIAPELIKDFVISRVVTEILQLVAFVLDLAQVREMRRRLTEKV